MSLEDRRKKILVVDDEPENIHILIEALGDEFTLVAARTGKKALAIAAATPHPDIILLDVMMPNMDGYEVCRRLKANPLTVNIPVIFVTSLSDSGDELHGLKIGAVDYILKLILVVNILCHQGRHLFRLINGSQTFPLKVVHKSLETCVAVGEGSIDISQPRL